jgi:hypothetical protein
MSYEPDLERLRTALNQTRALRLALDTLWDDLR